MALSFLISLLVVDSRWNVLGKATYVSNILPTKGPGAFSAAPGSLCLTRIKDLNMRVRLADPSLPTGLLINIFARDRSAFPSASEGAVLCVFQLKVLRPTLRSYCHLTYSQLTIFDCCSSRPPLPGQGRFGLGLRRTPVPRSLALVVSAAEVEQLRAWKAPGMAVQPSGPRSLALPTVNPPRPVIPPPPVSLKRLSELPDSGSVDLVVQVLKAGSPVLVWDGTVRDKLETWCVAWHPSMGRFDLFFSSTSYSPPYSWLTLAASDARLQLHLLLLERCQWVFFPRVELQLQGDQLIGGISEIWQVLD